MSAMRHLLLLVSCAFVFQVLFVCATQQNVELSPFIEVVSDGHSSVNSPIPKSISNLQFGSDCIAKSSASNSACESADYELVNFNCERCNKEIDNAKDQIFVSLDNKLHFLCAYGKQESENHLFISLVSAFSNEDPQIFDEICSKLAQLNRLDISQKLEFFIKEDLAASLITCFEREYEGFEFRCLLKVLEVFESNDLKLLRVDVWREVLHHFVKNDSFENLANILEIFPPMEALEGIIRERYRTGINLQNYRCYRMIFNQVREFNGAFKEGFDIFGSEFYIEIDEVNWLKMSFFYTESKFIQHHNLATHWNCSEEVYAFLMKYSNRLGYANFYYLDFGGENSEKFMCLFFKYLNVCSEHGLFIDFLYDILDKLSNEKNERLLMLLKHAFRSDSVIIRLKKAIYIWNEPKLLQLMQLMNEIMIIPLHWKIIFLKSFIVQSHFKAFGFFVQLLSAVPSGNNDCIEIIEYKLIPLIIKNQKNPAIWFEALTQRFKTICSLDNFARYIKYSMIYKKPDCLISLFEIYEFEVNDYCIAIMKILIESNLYKIYTYLFVKFAKQFEENDSLLRSLCAIIFALDKKSYFVPFKKYPNILAKVKEMIANEFAQFNKK